jgi:hypothetical protein
LIKHSGQLYTFKVGVRELGWRRRTTLNINEQLISPSDYVKINITEKLEGEKFKRFALDVCNGRIARLQAQGTSIIKDIVSALPGVSEDKEAELLGIKNINSTIIKKIKKSIPASELSRLDELTPLQIYFLHYWADSQNLSIADVWQDSIKNQQNWNTRYDNYKHSLLYTLRKGKRGIRKYYAGWNVYTQLAANNIRYLLELVDQSLLLHIKEGENLATPVSPKTQTIAAQNVGKKNLSELEGLSVHGAQLTKLLLSLGRIFQIMASDASGHTPELNQFHLSDGSDLIVHENMSNSYTSEAENLLKSAVMHLALIRSSGNKLADEADTKDYDYQIHPIFSSFFVFSYRRKRKMTLSAFDILNLVNNPRQAIKEILTRNNRNTEEELPEQLSLFEKYYGHS